VWSIKAKWYFLLPVNFLVYSKAQLRLQAGNRFMVLPEPKAARVLPAARPAFNLRFAKNTFAKKFKSAENTIWLGL
jgi:aromatic ring-cleaving dioxygenase